MIWRGWANSVISNRMAPDQLQRAMIARGSGERQRNILARYLDGTLSGEMALMYLLQASPDTVDIRSMLDAAIAACPEALAARERSLLHRLSDLATANQHGCDRIARMLGSGIDTDQPAASVEQGIEFCARLFDWSVDQCAEASVALYSLGNPAILNAATAEIVKLMRDWRLLGPTRDVLEIGCGIGRFQQGLAGEAHTVTGIDVSANMIRVARERCADCGNVDLQHCTGRDLAMFDAGTFDLVFAVDSFPYIFQSGMDLVERHFEEVLRVLKPRGDFLILEFSYHRTLEADQRDVSRLAAGAFDVLACGTRPFKLWDGSAFHLRARCARL